MTKMRTIQQSPIVIFAYFSLIGCQPQPSPSNLEKPTTAGSTSPEPIVTSPDRPGSPPDPSSLANLDEQILAWKAARLEKPNDTGFLTKYATAMRMAGRSTEAIQSLSITELEQLPALEKASLLAESGNWIQARETLSKGNLHTSSAFRPQVDNLFRHILRGEGAKAPDPTDEIQLVNLTLSFTGDRAGGAALQNLQLDRVARIRRIADLQTMQMIAPQEPAIAAMLRELEDLEKPFKDAKHLDNQPASMATTDPQSEDRRLYQLHCSSCHGVNGDGKGPASRFLSPPARSFTKEPMRYVSGVRSLATDEDLRKTILEGLKGVSMPGFPQLSTNEIEALVREVRRFQKQGLETTYDRNHQSGSNADNVGATIGNDSDRQNAKAAWVADRWRDTESLSLPVWLTQPSAGSSATAKKDGAGGTDGATNIGGSPATGAIVFRKMGCENCHATEDSTKTNQLRFNDSLGRTISARNLQKQPLRRGTARRELYWRIFLGIPGTPHPKVEGTLTDDETRLLVDYVAELAQATEDITSTNHSRRVSP